jgi:hypothetical protein
MPVIESEVIPDHSQEHINFKSEFLAAIKISQDIRSKIQTEEEYKEKIEPYLVDWTRAFAENATPKLMMECPIGLTYFSKFLATEMNTENLSGYLDFKAFQDVMLPQNREEEWTKVQSEIVKIKELYLDTGAPQELNISSKTRQAWMEHITKASKIKEENDVLEWKLKVKDELYDLMQNELIFQGNCSICFFWKY